MWRNDDESFMARCVELAYLAGSNTAPNPMVGAVLVHEGNIIGEGFHQKYGDAHAEVNCIKDALKNAPEKITSSTLYVSLEPCAHFGKTPPCADMIIEHKIPKVVIGCRDSFPAVNGKGVDILKNAGIDVVENVLQKEAISLNKRFFTFHKFKRPYITLKWAQTNDSFIASFKDERLLISNAITNRLVHKWRSREAGIMIGKNTAIKDDPLLDNRLWYGKPPVKIITDSHLKLPRSLKLFDDGIVIILNSIKDEVKDNIQCIKIDSENNIGAMLEKLYQLNIQSIFVEGGKKILQSFIDAGLWDEARIITNTEMTIRQGLAAPVLKDEVKIKETKTLTDRIEYYKNKTREL